MLAARFYKGKDNATLEDVPIPSVGRNDVLVKIQGIGVCRSDLHMILGTFAIDNLPVTMGHEGSGIVEQVGEDVTNVKKGDRVGIFYVQVCGECIYCVTGRENLCIKQRNLGFNLDGTWAEYLVVHSRSVLKLPDNVPFAEAALAGCAVVTAFHANLAGEVKAGNSVAIIGMGGVGFNGLQWSRYFGASPIIVVDIDQNKLERAKQSGADYVINSREEDPVEGIRRLTNGEGVDVAFEYIGLKPTIEQMIRSTKIGGTAVMVGISGSKIEIDALDFLGKGSHLKAVNNHTRSQMMTVLSLMGAKRIDVSKSISSRMKLSEADKAVDILRSQQGSPNRIVLTP
jgi:D-arabinose 1-dehydrogenase-like Zn-dependent alcohol dehydrogenase